MLTQKESYQIPSLEFIKLKKSDIITTSAEVSDLDENETVPYIGLTELW